MNIICPICRDENEKLFKCKTTLVYNSIYDLVECSNCKAIYFNPLPDVSQLEEFYSASYYDFDKYKEEGKGMVFANRYLKKIKEKGKFLDVGCATGFFINGIKNNSKWEVYGTDFSDKAVNYAKNELKLDVKKGNLGEIKFQNEYFDYIHLNNVIEHVLNPVELIKECGRIVKKDGIIMLSVPNGFNDSLPLTDFYKSEKFPSRSKDGHIFFFQKQTLNWIFENTGFSVISGKTYGFKRGLRNMGILPRKNDWKTGYYPDKNEKITKNDSKIAINSRKYNDLYYYYCFFLGELKMLPGLHNSGLDFVFLLSIKSR